jgi:hypothetical protein
LIVPDFASDNGHNVNYRRYAVNRTILRLDALFLLLAGSIQLVLEIQGHFFGMGVYADVFGHSPYTIGFFEAHGFAVLIALAVLNDNAKQNNVWHGRLVAIHVLLGGANLLFWQSFVAWDLVVMGVVATTLHGLFIATNAYYLLKEGAIWE